MKQRNIVLALAATFLAAAPAVLAAELEWTTGQIGGGWYGMATGIAKFAAEDDSLLKLTIVPGGSTANPGKIQNGKSQFAWGGDVLDYAAYNGKFDNEGKPHNKLRLIGASFSDNFQHALRGSGATFGYKELFTTAKNAKIAVTKAGSSEELTFRRVMAFYGTSYDDLRNKRGFKINQGDYAELTGQFKDGQVDYVFVSLGVPGAAIVDMLQGRKGELLEWPREVLDHLNKTYGYNSGVIPAGTYPTAQKGNVTTVRIGTTLDASADVSDDIVYRFIKSICKNQAKLPAIHQSMTAFDCKTGWKDAPIPLHAGAAKFYKEMGYMK